MTAVTSNTATEVLGVNPLDELRENGFAGMHERIVARIISKKIRGKSAAEFKSLTPSFRRIVLICSLFQLLPDATSG
jgi:hypothetical protein